MSRTRAPAWLFPVSLALLGVGYDKTTLLLILPTLIYKSFSGQLSR